MTDYDRDVRKLRWRLREIAEAGDVMSVEWQEGMVEINRLRMLRDAPDRVAARGREYPHRFTHDRTN